MVETKDRKQRKLKGERLEAFNKRFAEVSPPDIKLEKNYEAISFINKAKGIHKPSFATFIGLDRGEINLSFKNLAQNFFFLKRDDIGWIIEYLDDKLKIYLNSKKQTGD